MVVFYGVRNFDRNMSQLCATHCERRMVETPSVGNDVQCNEKLSKNSFLNYKPAARDQLSYAGPPHRKAVLSEFIKSLTA